MRFQLTVRGFTPPNIRIKIPAVVWLGAILANGVDLQSAARDFTPERNNCFKKKLINLLFKFEYCNFILPL
jgi:hypothetical protein